MNDDDNFLINITHHFYCQIFTKMYLYEQNTNQQNTEFIVIKILFWVYYQRNQRF